MVQTFVRRWGKGYFWGVMACGGLMLASVSCSRGERLDKEKPLETPAVSSSPTSSDLSDGAAGTWDSLSSFREAGEAPEAVLRAVREAFSGFREDVLSYRGDEAADRLSSQSLEYYAYMLKLLRVKVHHPGDFGVLRERISPSLNATLEIMSRRLAPEFLDRATSRELYALAFRQGWIGYRSMKTASIDNLRLFVNGERRYVMGDFVNASALGEKFMMRLGFMEEGGEWRIDLVPMFTGVEYAVNDMIVGKTLDIEGSVEATVEESERMLDVGHWQVTRNEGDGFRVKFPREPQYAEAGGEHIYTSQHHLYGQFDVRVKADASGGMYRDGLARRRRHSCARSRRNLLRAARMRWMGAWWYGAISRFPRMTLRESLCGFIRRSAGISCSTWRAVRDIRTTWWFRLSRVSRLVGLTNDKVRLRIQAGFRPAPVRA